MLRFICDGCGKAVAKDQKVNVVLSHSAWPDIELHYCKECSKKRFQTVVKALSWVDNSD